MAIVFVFSPIPWRWLDDALWFVLFKRLIFSWFVFWMLLFLQKAIKPISFDQLGKMGLNSFLFATRIWVVFYLCLIIHFNIKINVGLWRDTLYDPALYQFDQFSDWFIQAVLFWHPTVDGWFDLAPWYGVVYEFSFLFTFALFALVRRSAFRLMFGATVMTMLLGSLFYILLPAVGPFLYDTPASPYMQQVLPIMYEKYFSYVASDGQYYIPTFLIQGLAAMPSLHIAQILVFTYFIWRHLRWLSVLYIPITLFIFAEAMYTKYHYLLDLVIGAELAIIGIILTFILYEWRARSLLPATHRR